MASTAASPSSARNGSRATSSSTTTPTTAPRTGPTSASSSRSSTKGELVAFSATTAHHLDLGALTPGSCGIVDATDAYAEGLQFNAIKIEEEGRRNEWIWRFIRDNVRAAQLVVGDMEAQVAACRIGAERFSELVERYGLETVQGASEDLMDYSERMLRREIEKLPDGSYEAEGFIDGFQDDPNPANRDLRDQGDGDRRGLGYPRRPGRHLAADRPAA